MTHVLSYYYDYLEDVARRIMTTIQDAMLIYQAEVI